MLQDLINSGPLNDPSTAGKYVKAIADAAEQDGLNFCAAVVVASNLTGRVLFYKDYHSGPGADEPNGCLPNFQQASACAHAHAPLPGTLRGPSAVLFWSQRAAASCGVAFRVRPNQCVGNWGQGSRGGIGRPSLVLAKIHRLTLAPQALVVPTMCMTSRPAPCRPRSSVLTTPSRLRSPAVMRWARWARPAAPLWPPVLTPLLALPSEFDPPALVVLLSTAVRMIGWALWHAKCVWCGCVPKLPGDVTRAPSCLW